MRLIQKSKGITLIALVITIIVLLILVGVSIATLGGDNGIIVRARKAKTTTEEKQSEEEAVLLVNEYEMYKKMCETEGKKPDVEEFLEKNYKDKYKVEDGKYKIETESGENLEIDDKGNVKLNDAVINVNVDDILYELTYNANGGSVSPNSKNIKYNEMFGQLPMPKYAGYSFNGWYTQSSGGTKITEDTIFNTQGNQTIYAQWTQTQPKTYSKGPSTGEEYTLSEGNRIIITYGECNIVPSKFECDFECGNYNASSASNVIFTVQGYKNNSWVEIFTKKGTRPVSTRTYTIFKDIYNYSENDIFTNFRILFNSTDNEKYIYAKFRVY